MMLESDTWPMMCDLLFARSRAERRPPLVVLFATVRTGGRLERADTRILPIASLAPDGDLASRARHSDSSSDAPDTMGICDHDWPVSAVVTIRRR